MLGRNRKVKEDEKQMNSKGFAFIAMSFEAMEATPKSLKDASTTFRPKKKAPVLNVPFGVVSSEFWQFLSVCIQRANARAARERVTVPKALRLPVNTVECETDYDFEDTNFEDTN
jgi:hypothetical protein